jgi:DNA (cytosine-5)-methyltransferase 1
MKQELTVLDLFSGIGGFSLGLERAGLRTIAFCEIEPFCQNVLQKHWPHVPIAQDIRQLRHENGRLYDAERLIYKGRIDLICGGFPCQPFSVAGRKKGTSDDRDLWPEMFRIIQQAQPSWVVGENVANFAQMAFTRSKIDLEREGYAVQPFVIPACAVGAPHRRDRVWIVAYADGKRCYAGSDYRQERSVLYHQHWHAEEDQRSGNIGQRGIGAAGEIAADDGRKRIQRSEPQSLCGQQAFSWCKDVRRTADYFNRPDIPEPLICRDSDGFSTRVDRLRALGNAVVPQIPEAIGHAIIKSITG